MTVTINVGAFDPVIRRGMLYAQEKCGQKLHIVPVYSDETVGQPLCSRRVRRWRIIINMPLGHCCRNCRRVLKKRQTA